MTTGKRTDPRVGVKGANKDRGKNPVRGVRIEEDLWDAVKVKAEADGSNRNTALVLLARAYVADKINLSEIS